MNIEALERTAKIIESKNPNVFNLATFLGANNEEGANCDIEAEPSTGAYNKAQALWEKLEDKGQLEKIPHKCGATACAVGFAGLNKWFRDREFITDHNGWIYYKGLIHFDAVCAFYELTEKQAFYLFTVGAYSKKNGDNPQKVAQRIRNFIKRHQNRKKN